MNVMSNIFLPEYGAPSGEYVYTSRQFDSSPGLNKSCTYGSWCNGPRYSGHAIRLGQSEAIIYISIAQMLWHPLLDHDILGLNPTAPIQVTFHIWPGFIDNKFFSLYFTKGALLRIYSFSAELLFVHPPMKLCAVQMRKQDYHQFSVITIHKINETIEKKITFMNPYPIELCKEKESTGYPRDNVNFFWETSHVWPCFSQPSFYKNGEFCDH